MLFGSGHVGRQSVLAKKTNAFATTNPTLSLDFMTPGALDARITFTRASTGTYYDSSGTMRVAAANAARWDYDPVTNALRGLLIEEQRQNVWLQSSDLSNPATQGGQTGTAAGPTITGNNIVAPDGTLTGTRVQYPIVTGAGSSSAMQQSFAVTAAPWSVSVWLRGVVGGERVYICTTPDGVLYYRTQCILTTTWQRFTLTTPNLTATTWYFLIGTDLRDASQTSTSAQTIYAWGMQVETGYFPTSYVPTTGVAVTRAADLASMPTAAWFNTTNGTYQTEFIPGGIAFTAPAFLSGNAGSPTIGTDGSSTLSSAIRTVVQVFQGTGPPFIFLSGAINKAAFGYLSGASMAAVNGGVFGPNATAFSVTGTVVQFGSDGITPGTYSLDGWLRSVRYWPRVLTSGELQAVTT